MRYAILLVYHLTSMRYAILLVYHLTSMRYAILLVYHLTSMRYDILLVYHLTVLRLLLSSVCPTSLSPSLAPGPTLPALQGSLRRSVVISYFRVKTCWRKNFNGRT